MRKFGIILAIAGTCLAQAPGQPQLKTRDEAAAQVAKPNGPLWVIPTGTKIPIQLRQPVSTKNAQPGDAIYAQTTFPVVLNGAIAVPAGTWVQGVVDEVKRAGRIKGTAELKFHLTQLIYANGYTLDIAAAIAQVPGGDTVKMKEPDTVQAQPEKGKDLERIGTAASHAGQIGSLAGVAANPTLRSLGVGGLTGVAAGTLIALMARGSDVRFEAGTAVEIALTQAMAIDRTQVMRSANGAP